MSSRAWTLLASLALWALFMVAAFTAPAWLIAPAYLAIGFFAARNTLLRVKAYRREQGYRYALDLTGGDIALVVIMAGVLWPFGWPTSFSAYPALWTYRAPKRGPRDWSLLNGWADRKLDKED